MNIKDKARTSRTPETEAQIKRYRVEDVRKATLNGKYVQIFKAFRKVENAYVFCGEFSAPPRMPLRDLWKIADAVQP